MVIVRNITAFLVLGVLAEAFPLGITFPYMPYFPPDVGYLLRELGTAGLIAVLAAQVEDRHGSRYANVVTGVLAYLGARGLAGGFDEVGMLRSWSPYPLWSWFQYDCFWLIALYLQAWLVRRIWPFYLRGAGRIRRPAAWFICLCVFLGWDWLSRSVGSASAGFICALAMLVMMAVAGERRFMLFGIVACAAFLAVSALVLEAPPAVAGMSLNAPDVELRFALPVADSQVDLSGLHMYVTVEPGPATLFHCPTQADVGIFLVDRDSKASAALAKSGYAIEVSGTTSIVDMWGTSKGSSHVVTAAPGRGGTYTEWLGTGWDDTAPTGDIFDFSMPLQSWRSMGTCYVVVPQVNNLPSREPTGYAYEPLAATVSLSGVSLADTAPQPTADTASPGDYDWTCYDFSDPKVPVSSQCPGVAVMAASWAGSYTQVTMLLVGSLIAIAAERWFHSASHEEEAGHDDEAAHDNEAGHEEEAGHDDEAGHDEADAEEEPPAP